MGKLLDFVFVARFRSMRFCGIDNSTASVVVVVVIAAAVVVVIIVIVTTALWSPAGINEGGFFEHCNHLLNGFCLLWISTNNFGENERAKRENETVEAKRNLRRRIGRSNLVMIIIITIIRSRNGIRNKNRTKFVGKKSCWNFGTDFAQGEIDTGVVGRCLRTEFILDFLATVSLVITGNSLVIFCSQKPEIICRISEMAREEVIDLWQTEILLSSILNLLLLLLLLTSVVAIITAIKGVRWKISWR